MNSRDNQLWLQLWRDKSIDFHQPVVNTLLTRFWPELKLNQGNKVFVPLCGKSLDMIWIAGQGYDVIGVELSPIAVRDFFKENGLKAKKTMQGNFTLWQHKNISILCGDYFAISKDDLGEIDIVYDRASLTALPEDIRRQYVAHLETITRDTTQIFLLTTEDAAAGASLEHALGVDDEIKSLFTENFEIDLVHVDSIYEFDSRLTEQSPCRAEYKVYQLISKIMLSRKINSHDKE